MTKPIQTYEEGQLMWISQLTMGHCDWQAGSYWEGTRNHDVGQNHAALQHFNLTQKANGGILAFDVRRGPKIDA